MIYFSDILRQTVVALLTTRVAFNPSSH